MEAAIPDTPGVEEQEYDYQEDQDEIEEQQETEEQRDQLNDSFYFRYYNGHNGKFGTEFIEFELVGKDQLLRYANETHYRRDSTIRKEVKLNKPVIAWLRQTIQATNVMELDDSQWPEADDVGRQELEIKLGSVHIFFVTTKLSSKADVAQYKTCAQDLQIFYDLTLDVKSWLLDIINLHFRIGNL